MIASAFNAAVFISVFIVTLVVCGLAFIAALFAIQTVVEWIQERRWKHDENA